MSVRILFFVRSVLFSFMRFVVYCRCFVLCLLYYGYEQPLNTYFYRKYMLRNVKHLIFVWNVHFSRGHHLNVLIMSTVNLQLSDFRFFKVDFRTRSKNCFEDFARTFFSETFDLKSRERPLI